MNLTSGALGPVSRMNDFKTGAMTSFAEVGIMRVAEAPEKESRVRNELKERKKAIVETCLACQRLRPGYTR